ncbi:MAG: hypothetical protein M0R80_08655 [Proteobacteria bacterium]|jgi:ADP-heptose:LPS heptosyltransferase|nr:hypothetical protein [Pseudomonadota bacterium]
MVKKVLFKSNKKFVSNASLSLRDFYDRKDKILILRAAGGLGDILMHRMMFEDFKKIDPNIKITLAVPPRYFDALKDHPYIDELVDNNKVDISQFNVSYNTTSACVRYEMSMAPLSGLHRSDIWANHCGVELTEHNMHINIDPVGLKYGQDLVRDFRKTGPVVLLCPVSAMQMKNLTDQQMEGVVTALRSRNCCVIASHITTIPQLQKMDVPTITETNGNVHKLFGLVNAVDYVISVDTSHFHLSGGLQKPMLGIFTFADGKVYGKYYKHELVQKHRDNGNWDCGPCYNYPICPKSNIMFKPCLTEITVNMIVDGIDRMFKRWPPNHVIF